MLLILLLRAALCHWAFRMQNTHIGHLLTMFTTDAALEFLWALGLILRKKLSSCYSFVVHLNIRNYIYDTSSNFQPYECFWTILNGWLCWIPFYLSPVKPYHFYTNDTQMIAKFHEFLTFIQGDMWFLKCLSTNIYYACFMKCCITNIFNCNILQCFIVKPVLTI